MKKERGWRWAVIFATCTLAVPMVAALMGYYGATVTFEQAKPALVTGALLGLAHIVLRPALRMVFAPLGCLTFGLFGMVIDVGLLYGCDYLVDGFEVPGLLYAVVTAVVINLICAVAAGRK